MLPWFIKKKKLQKRFLEDDMLDNILSYSDKNLSIHVFSAAI